MSAAVFPLRGVALIAWNCENILIARRGSPAASRRRCCLQLCKSQQSSEIANQDQ
jgi:hypothetical protein